MTGRQCYYTIVFLYVINVKLWFHEQFIRLIGDSNNNNRLLFHS